MEGRKRFLQLILGVCLLICHVKSANVKIYGSDPNNPYEDMTRKLEKEKAEKLRLEKQLAGTTNAKERDKLQKELEKVICAIGKMEVTYRVVYRDHVEAMAEKTDHFRNEKKRLLRKLIATENLFAEALVNIEAANQKDLQKIKAYQQKVNELATERDRIAEEYAAYTKSQYQQQERIKQENQQLMKEREEIMQKLKEAQDLHSKALEAMAVTTQEDYRPVGIPYKDAINELGYDMRKLISTTKGRQLVLGLVNIQAKLESLLQKLYEESEIPTVSTPKSLENELAKMETESMRLRDEHDQQRKDLLEKIKNKDFVDYDKEKIISLREANEEVADMRKVLQEVAQQSAYLKGISQVADLIKECSHVLKDVLDSGTSLRRSKEPSKFTPTKGLLDIVSLSDPQNQAIGQTGIIRTPAFQKQQLSSLPEEPEDVEEDAELESYDEKQAIRLTIHEKVLLYKNLQELYRTRLSTKIVKGLTKINKRISFPLPGCEVAPLMRIRQRFVKWANEVQYALRLSKKLHKDDNWSIIGKFFLGFLVNLRDALYTLAGGKVIREVDIQVDNKSATSIERFDKYEIGSDFDKNFKYINAHLPLLEIDAKRNEQELKEFRYNFIFVKKAPEVVEERTQRKLQELRDGHIDENKAIQEFKPFLRDMEVAEKRLRQLFDAIMFSVKSTIENEEQGYQSALEEYENCRADQPEEISVW